MNIRIKHGFTLIEILLVVGIMTVLSAAGYLVAEKASQASVEAKVAGDMAMLNRAGRPNSSLP